jgi:hypothetical protein
MVQRQMLQNPLALGRKLHVHFTLVISTADLLDETPLREPFHQFDGAVVMELETLSEIRDARRRAVSRTLHGEHELMVLRLQSRAPGRVLTEAQEAANLVTEFRQGLVVSGFKSISVSHKLGNIILSYSDICWKMAPSYVRCHNGDLAD